MKMAVVARRVTRWPKFRAIAFCYHFVDQSTDDKISDPRLKRFASVIQGQRLVERLGSIIERFCGILFLVVQKSSKLERIRPTLPSSGIFWLHGAAAAFFDRLKKPCWV